ncbi:MAG: FAD-binding oxidoreductase [Thermoleophilaceae bacterium]|nr:FAD-binding oxidoreductase [Thermoleophilaceae bacterium]
MDVRRLKFWGWGFEDQQPPFAQVSEAAAGIRRRLGFPPDEVERPPSLGDLELPQPRLSPPASLADICSSDVYERATHAYGKSYRDIVRALRRRIDHPPDVVARPRDEGELEAVLDWCEEAGAAAIPFGGGTSVVGGVEPDVGDGYAGTVSIDLKALDRVLEVDRESLAARIQAGASGPRLERQLREHGLTLRHYPQSFEHSTLGGWIATRAGGHFATLETHIDDLVESVRALTPSGWWESRRLPGSGAGPSPDRLLIGSEGVLGAITEAWVRVRERPRFKASAGVLFRSFEDGAAAARALAQSGLHPSNCRLLDPAEAATTGAAPEGRALLVLGFESADHPLGPWLARGLELCRDHGGEPEGEPRISGDLARADDGVATWRDAFLQAPYLRDTMILGGVIAETLETAITWDRFADFVAAVRESAERAVAGECGAGRVTCRLTHVYPDGAAPYFTVLAPARRGSELEQWDAVKRAASEAILAAGGTITHHHAVGRDHRPWYDRQRPDPFAAALRGAKAAVDPSGILNPGVLVDPEGGS